MPQEGFLKAVFDTRFTTLVTPKIIRVLFILAIIAIAIGAIAFVISAFAADTAFGLVTLFILAPLGFLLYVIVARVYLEIVIVLFKINESAQAIAANTGATSPPPAGTGGPDVPPSSAG